MRFVGLGFLLVMLSTASMAGFGLSLEKEIEKGRLEHQKVIAQFGIYRDAKLQDYVNRVGQRIAKESTRTELTYTFTLLNDDMINAFALPGGYVYITRGMLLHLGSESELAAVLGHDSPHYREAWHSTAKTQYVAKCGLNGRRDAHGATRGGRARTSPWRRADYRI